MKEDAEIPSYPFSPLDLAPKGKQESKGHEAVKLYFCASWAEPNPVNHAIQEIVASISGSSFLF